MHPTCSKSDTHTAIGGGGGGARQEALGGEYGEAVVVAAGDAHKRHLVQRGHHHGHVDVHVVAVAQPPEVAPARSPKAQAPSTLRYVAWGETLICYTRTLLQDVDGPAKAGLRCSIGSPRTDPRIERSNCIPSSRSSLIRSRDKKIIHSSLVSASYLVGFVFPWRCLGTSGASNPE